jgi:hypothetical protein
MTEPINPPGGLGFRSTRPPRDNRHVETRAIKDAVKGREAEILDAIEIDWRSGQPHITCPYPGHPDEHLSWRWDSEKSCSFCSCIEKSHSIFDVVIAEERIDFQAAKIHVAHGHINPEAQHEMQLSIMRVLNNAPAGITLHQKQIALICAIEELAKSFPHDCQNQNVLAVIATMILGLRLLIGVSMAGGGGDPEGMQ